MPDIRDAFLELFFQFEHGLKHGGYLQTKKAADADWIRFANDLGRAFFDDVRASGAADTLIAHPPGKLINDAGRPRWDMPTQPISNVQTLFTHGVCQARNNYFHGDKFVGSPADWERDECLLTEAAWVLRAAMQRRPDVFSAVE